MQNERRETIVTQSGVKVELCVFDKDNYKQPEPDKTLAALINLPGMIVMPNVYVSKYTPDIPDSL